MWWPFKKMAERRLIQSFETGLRLIQVSLFSRLCYGYSKTMAEEPAKVLAAQVVNYLKGDDVVAVMHGSAEPLRTEIARIKDCVPVYAAQAMAESGDTREAIVATLRMRAVLEFIAQGKSYFESDQHKRTEELLRTYGPEFPEEIKPEKYLSLAHRYRQDTYGET